jgi:SAM-dependent methyltransferase
MMAGNLHAGFADHHQEGMLETLSRFLDVAATQPEIRESREAIRRRLDPQAGEVVLDVGCGLGHHACLIASQYSAVRVLGLDREAVVESAAERADELGVDVEWIAGDAESIPLPDDSIDACMTERVLKYLPDPALAMDEIARVLKPGGRFAGFELDYDATVLGGSPDAAPMVLDVLRESVGEARMGRRLPCLLHEAGLTNISCRPLAFSPSWEIQDAIIGNTLREAVSQGRLLEDRVDAWLERHQRAFELGLFSAAFVGCIVAASMPVEAR